MLTADFPLSTVSLPSNSSVRDIALGFCFYQGERLCLEHGTLAGHMILPNSNLYVRPVILPSIERVHVRVATHPLPRGMCPPHAANRTFMLFVAMDCPIQRLRRQISDFLNVDGDWLMLTFMDVFLEDRFTLRYYSFIDYCSVDCAIGPLTGAMKRVTCERYGEPILSITVPPEPMTVAGLHRYIASEHSWAPGSFAIATRENNLLLQGFVTVAEAAHQIGLSLRVYGRVDPVVYIVWGGGVMRQVHAVEFQDGDTVLSLKKQLRDFLRIPIARQALRKFNSKTDLPDAAALSELGIGSQTRLEFTELRASGFVVRVHAGGRAFDVPIESGSQLVSDIKWKVARELGLEQDMFELVQPSAALDNGAESLMNAALSENSKVLAVPEDDAVTVGLAFGVRTLAIGLPRRTTVGQIAEIVGFLGGAGGKQQRLFAGGRLLKDEQKTLADIGIEAGHVIFAAPG
jgi:hypothetical protein